MPTSTIDPTDAPTPLDRVFDQARRMLGRARLPRKVRDQLATWARGRLRRGVPEEELTDLVRGTSARKQAEGVLLAEATGEAAVLDRNVTDIGERLASGAHDDALEALGHVESANADRVGVSRALDARRLERDVERLLDGTLDDLGQALATGDWDEHLDLLGTTEAGRKDRTGARQRIETRRELQAAIDVLDGSVAKLRTWLDEAESPPIEAMLAHERRHKDRVTAIAALERHQD